MRQFFVGLAGVAAVAVLAPSAVAQGGPSQGAAPGLQGHGSSQSEGSGPPSQPFHNPPPQQPGDERRETEAAPPHQGGGCQFRERKLELIV